MELEILSWIGNLFIVVGLWWIGNKKRWAFIYSMIGELLWTVFSIASGMWSLAFICSVFFFLAMRSYVKWKPEKTDIFNITKNVMSWAAKNPDGFNYLGARRFDIPNNPSELTQEQVIWIHELMNR